MTIPAESQARFAADLDALVAAQARIGLAVSGGPDSLALLLLAHAERPGAIAVATVDHGLRKDSADEAAMVGQVCAELGVPHAILAADWAGPPTANVQAEARAMRYRLLGAWAERHRLTTMVTAHHADDQAETLLMRLSRGAGLSGLAGVRRSRSLVGDIRLVRPLLGWRKAELETIVTSAGLTPADDPSNRDPAYDRARMRALIAHAGIFESARLAQSASALADADVALEWIITRLAAERIFTTAEALVIDPTGLPRDLQRRLLLAAFRRLGAPQPRGPDLMRALAALAAGESATLSGLLMRGNGTWRLSKEGPRAARD